LRTIANPSPPAGDNFSFALPGLGADKLLVGAHGEDAGETDRGRAYLFHTNGALITTLTNPAPGISNHVVIGATGDDTVATNAGAAYVFDLAGTWAATLLNPAPVASDLFGASVAGVGADAELIGTPGHDLPSLNSGIAYVFPFASYAPGVCADSIDTVNLIEELKRRDAQNAALRERLERLEALLGERRNEGGK
jgi:hypothetical protein